MDAVYSPYIFGALIWIPLTIWTISLVHWSIQGDIDFGTGIVGIVLGFGMGFTAIRPPTPWAPPVACILVFATVIFFPLLRSTMERRDMKSLEIDGVENAYRMLGQRPDNPFAKFRLAESIYRLGMCGHAVAIADSALAYLPERVADEELRVLKRWKSRGVPPETLKPISCVVCHTPCPPGWTHCRTCGAQFLLDRVRGRVLPKGVASRLLAIWASLVMATLGIVAASALPPILAIVVTVAILAGALSLFIIAMRGAGAEPA